MSYIVNLIIFLLVLTLGLSFAILNAEPVELDYYFGSQRLSLSLVVLITLIMGVLAGVVASLGVIIKLKREVSRLRKANQAVDAELASLRTLPLKDPLRESP
jgi:putative membrane protein